MMMTQGGSRMQQTQIDRALKVKARDLREQKRKSAKVKSSPSKEKRKEIFLPLVREMRRFELHRVQ